MAELRVLSVASEVYPLVKTGGLADVAGALPAALSPHGVEITTLMPGYPAVQKALAGADTLHSWSDFFGGPAKLRIGKTDGLRLIALDAPHLYDRPGNPYLDSTGKDWPDNARRFAALSYAAAELGRGACSGYVPDLLHCHDWQAGLVPAYLKFQKTGTRRPATVITIHNLAYQGAFPATLLNELRLPAAAFTMEGVEYYGQIGFLKAGLALAERITTVSPTYAVEIQGSEMGMGLDGLLRHRADVVTGILNGLDTAAWNPAADPHLAACYDAANLEARRENKRALQTRFGLAPESKGPLVVLITRMTWQKGIDLVPAVLPRLVAGGGQLALLGNGEAALERQMADAAKRHAGAVGVSLGYDEKLAHLLQGGGDAILVPSRFEPCGLTQLTGLRYGTVPVVARTGGLADTVVDANEAALASGVATGFQFTPGSADALQSTVQRLLHAYADPKTWQQMQRTGMQADVSWQRPSRQYADLYRSLVKS